MLDVTALAHRVGGRLLPVAAPHPQAGDNPWAIEEDPGAFHTTGWFGAYDAGHSAFAVAAESSADIAAPVDFARAHRTGLVIKGTGHDYLGRSSAPDRCCCGRTGCGRSPCTTPSSRPVRRR